MTTSRHKPEYSQVSRLITLPVPTADTGLLIDTVIQRMHHDFKPHLSYHRAGVWLQDFITEGHLQTDLLGVVNLKRHDKEVSRMNALDQLNMRYGKGTVFYASEQLNTVWQPRKDIRTPRYTTRWEELPKVR